MSRTTEAVTNVLESFIQVSRWLPRYRRDFLCFTEQAPCQTRWSSFGHVSFYCRRDVTFEGRIRRGMRLCRIGLQTAESAACLLLCFALGHGPHLALIMGGGQV